MRMLICLFLLSAVLCNTLVAQANDAAQHSLRLTVLGDSLAAGYGLSFEEAFPAQLDSALRDAGYNVRVNNAGVSGDTTAGGLTRVDWILGDEPAVVIVALGGNDTLRGIPVETTRNNLDAILVQLKARGVRPILAGMRAPRNFGPDYAVAFDKIYPELARQHGVPLHPFFLDGVALEQSLNQADGIHPNAAGVKIMVDKILPLVTSVLDSLAR